MENKVTQFLGDSGIHINEMYVVTRVEWGRVNGVWGPFDNLGAALAKVNEYNAQRGHKEFEAGMYFDSIKVRVPQ